MVEVGEDDRVICKLWEQFFSHVPSAGLLFVPARVVVLGIRRALPMVAAEECIAAVYDILAVDPIIVVAAAVIIDDMIFEVDIAAPRAKSLGRH